MMKSLMRKISVVACALITLTVFTSSAFAATYKSTMVPFDQLTPSDRIVILQNTLNYSAEGFYTPDTKPMSQLIAYNGADTKAYPISYALSFLTNGVKSDVKVYDTSKKETIVKLDDFMGMYVIIDDFMSGNSPVLYNPKTETKIADFKSALTANNEVILSVIVEEDAPVRDLVAFAGWGENAPSRLVATDKFYVPLTKEECAVGELRGTFSGDVNASVPGMKKAGGKINDIMYIERIKD